MGYLYLLQRLHGDYSNCYRGDANKCLDVNLERVADCSRTVIRSSNLIANLENAKRKKVRNHAQNFT